MYTNKIQVYIVNKNKTTEFIFQNKMVMIFGTIAIFSCVGYIIYMRRNSDNMKYYSAITSDGSVDFKKKTSKWTVQFAAFYVNNNYI